MPYDTLKNLLSRYSYLEKAGQYFLSSKRPNQSRHRNSLCYSKVAFESEIIDRIEEFREYRGRSPAQVERMSLNLESEYLRYYYEVMSDAQIEHNKVIVSLAQPYTNSHCHWEVTDEFPTSEFIQTHTKNAEGLFSFLSADIDSVTILNVDEVWARVSSEMSYIVEKTNDIRVQMGSCLKIVEDRKKEKRTTLLASQTARYTGMTVAATLVAALPGLFALAGVSTVKEAVNALTNEISELRQAPTVVPGKDGGKNKTSTSQDAKVDVQGHTGPQ